MSRWGGGEDNGDEEGIAALPVARVGFSLPSISLLPNPSCQCSPRTSGPAVVSELIPWSHTGVTLPRLRTKHRRSGGGDNVHLPAIKRHAAKNKIKKKAEPSIRPGPGRPSLCTTSLAVKCNCAAKIAVWLKVTPTRSITLNSRSSEPGPVCAPVGSASERVRTFKKKTTLKRCVFQRI